uniref:D-aminoacyl-tRNA deacylase n=1 Tax=Rhabditophanes sp. KR3021 TaxID=114890 RepID=A0AC35U2J8_9BILA
MKAVIQRVTEASVTVNGEIISSIGKGLLVLIGLETSDKPEDAEFIQRKILNLRLFDGENGKRWDKSVKDMGYEVLCVSQFTLHAVLKGNKLDFHKSMNPSDAPIFYSTFLENMKKAHELTKDGQFGAMMSVNIVNDGPVTINIDSKKE